MWIALGIIQGMRINTGQVFFFSFLPIIFFIFFRKLPFLFVTHLILAKIVFSNKGT